MSEPCPFPSSGGDVAARRCSAAVALATDHCSIQGQPRCDESCLPLPGNVRPFSLDGVENIKSPPSMNSIADCLIRALTSLVLLLAAPTAIAVTPMVVGGDGHTVALKNNATLVAVGEDASSQIGSGRLTLSRTPLQVMGLGKIRALAEGDGQSLALKLDSMEWAWGGGALWL